MITPCINICVVRSGICAGCKRTISEIANWSTMTNEQRIAIMERLKANGR